MMLVAGSAGQPSQRMTSGAPGSAGAGAGGMPSAGTGAGASVSAAGNGGAGAGGARAVGGEENCCHGLGQCIASADVAADRRALYARDACQDAVALCQPRALQDTTFLPRTCGSVLQAEGRCLPDCLATLAVQTERLPRDVCADHELCAPCFDPVTGTATGACALGADLGPRRLPRTFTTCCGSLGSARGLCVPQSYVPKGISVPQQECSDATLSCVPREWVSDPAAKPTQCTDDLRGSGVCVPQCIATAIGGLITSQFSCNAGDQCYPCQIIGGQATGLCTAEL